MIDESLLKSHFIGRDGFRWWLGQIAPVEAWEEQANGNGWGYRYKVRILGYHPLDISELSNDKDLADANTKRKELAKAFVDTYVAFRNKK